MTSLVVMVIVVSPTTTVIPSALAMVVPAKAIVVSAVGTLVWVEASAPASIVVASMVRMVPVVAPLTFCHVVIIATLSVPATSVVPTVVPTVMPAFPPRSLAVVSLGVAVVD